MEASYRMLLDGEVKANGSSAESGAGGGAGGSVVLKAAHFSGKYHNVQKGRKELFFTSLLTYHDEV